MVSRLVVNYWVMANIPTVELRTITSRVVKLVEKYNTLVKLKAKQNPAEVKKREDFVSNLANLFDIASSEAEKEMLKNRLLGNKDKEEDLKFLEDQRGPRVGSMGSRDICFDQAQQRKVFRESSEQIHKERELQRKKDMETKGEVENQNDENNDSTDDEFSVPTPAKLKRSDAVLVEIPRDIMKSPEVSGMLDRLKMTNNSAMGIFSSLMKGSTMEGKQVDLNEFTCSTSTLRRSRNNNRSILFELAKEEFSENKPTNLNLHWDGKQISNIKCQGPLST